MVAELVHVLHVYVSWWLLLLVFLAIIVLLVKYYPVDGEDSGPDENW